MKRVTLKEYAQRIYNDLALTKIISWNNGKYVDMKNLTITANYRVLKMK